MGRTVGRKSTKSLLSHTIKLKKSKKQTIRLSKKSLRKKSECEVDVIDFSVLDKTASDSKLNLTNSSFHDFVGSGSDQSEEKACIASVSQKLLDRNKSVPFLHRKICDKQLEPAQGNDCQTEVIIVENEYIDNRSEESGTNNLPNIDDIYDDNIGNDMSDDTFVKNVDEANGEDKNEVEFVVKRKGYRSVLVLKHPTEICFRGKAQVKCILGSCSIHGYEVKQGMDPVDIFSPTSHSFLTLAPLTGEPMNKIAQFVTADILNKTGLNELLEDTNQLGNGKCVVVLLDRLIPLANFESSKVPQYRDLYKLDDPKARYSVCSVRESNYLCVSSSREYNIAMDEWKSKIIDGVKPVVMVVGGKNSGKSTLNRMLINCTLNHTNTVNFLDCDVGQAEFTPSGFVSLHEINRPVIGPPFTHQQNSKYMCYYGEITPSKALTRFIRSVEYIYSCYKNQSSRFPLVVNTLGWNEGLGLKIIVDLIHMIRPTIIIQLECSYDYKNFPPLTSDYLASTPGWLYNTSTDKRGPPSRFDNQMLFMLDSEVPTKHKFPLKADKYRELSLLSYLSRPLDDGTRILHMEPYKISFKDVVLHDCQQPADHSQILYSFNASVVALCQVDMSISYTRKESGLHFLEETPISPCIGLGIIRAIDVKNEHIYLITSVPLVKLSKVNCLMKGSLSVPNDFFLQQTDTLDTSELPYVGHINKTIGSSYLNNRSKMPRKQYLQQNGSNSMANS